MWMSMIFWFDMAAKRGQVDTMILQGEQDTVKRQILLYVTSLPIFLCTFRDDWGVGEDWIQEVCET